MGFTESTLFDPYGPTDEPVRWRRLLALAIVLTFATVSAGLLAGG